MCFVQKGILRNVTKFTGKHLTLAQVFSGEFYKSSKNNFFTEHRWMTASKS